MSLYQKLTKVMDDRDVEGYVELIHEDAEIVFHKSGNKFTKSEWASKFGELSHLTTDWERYYHWRPN